MSRLMGKPTICIGENKGADQLRGNREADQRLCFRYSDSTIPLLLKSEISSFYLSSVLVQAGLCRTCSETTLLVFPRGGSYLFQEGIMCLIEPLNSRITAPNYFLSNLHSGENQHKPIYFPNGLIFAFSQKKIKSPK